MATRVYAVAGRGKLLGVVFCVLIAAQFGSGLCNTVWYGEHQSESLGSICSFMVSRLSLAIKLPELDLDAYKLCLAQRWRPGEVTFSSITVVFGTSSP